VSQPEFTKALSAGYVFLRVDLPAATPAAVALREQNDRLRERYGVTVYPTLLVLAPSGDKLAKIDVTKPTTGESYLAAVIAAVREMHDLIGLPSLPSVDAGGKLAPAPSSKGPFAPVKPTSITSSLLSAGWRGIATVGVGVLVAGVLFWLVWRNWATPQPVPRPAGLAARIADAASGLPTYEEIITWPKDRVRMITLRLAELEGYFAELQPPDSDADILLKRRTLSPIEGIVCCAGANAGVIPVKRIRELFGMMNAEGAKKGWFVAPLGFAAEARTYAEKHQLQLIDGHLLMARLRDIPPVELPNVTRNPWTRE
jgi:hypothetical protein